MIAHVWNHEHEPDSMSPCTDCYALAYAYPEPEPDCPELRRLEEAFLDDPMTAATGMGGEMLPLVRQAHFRKHPDCPAKEA